MVFNIKFKMRFNFRKNRKMEIAIVGAGAAGLNAARHVAYTYK